MLGALGMARMVAGALGEPRRLLNERYRTVQRALIEAVTSTHVPWRLVPGRTLTKLRTAMEFYEYVFSTNYDLVAYWALMSREQGAHFVDFFLWDDPFDPTHEWEWATDRTKIFYLHGGIHLFRRLYGGTIKRKARAGNLLDLFARPLKNTIPLFISEGSYEDKIAAIQRNDYLSFAFDRFARCRGRVVIFGHSLGSADKHIIDVLNEVDGRKIAVGLLRGSPEDIRQQKAHFVGQLSRANLSFFDASTHPLGDPGIKIPPQ